MVVKYRWFYVFHHTVCALKSVHCRMQLDSGKYPLSDQTRQKCVLSDVLDWIIVMRITIFAQAKKSLLIHIVYVNDTFQLDQVKQEELNLLKIYGVQP